jgi:hypothetical protein
MLQNLLNTTPRRVAHEESGLSKVLYVLQLNGCLAHIFVEAPALLALEEKGIYFSISRSLFSKELIKERRR